MIRESTSGMTVVNPRMWRNLVRFVAESDDLWYVLVPGWSRYVAVAVRTSELPDCIREVAHSGYRCHAFVNIGEEDAFKIVFQDWEVA